MMISAKLKEAIIASKKTKYAVAIGAGIDPAVLRRFLSGERDIKLKTADRLAEYLELEFVKRKNGDSKLKI